MDEVAAERQAEALTDLTGTAFYARAAAAAGAGNELGQATLRDHLGGGRGGGAEAEAAAAVGVGRRRTARGTARGKTLDRRAVIAGLAVLWLLLGCAVLGGFGVYGMYVFLHGGAGGAGLDLPFRFGPREPAPTPARAPAPEPLPVAAQPATSEIVIKIVREVVHVHAPDGGGGHGEGGGKEKDEEDEGGEALEERIAEAAAGAVKEALGRSEL